MRQSSIIACGAVAILTIGACIWLYQVQRASTHRATQLEKAIGALRAEVVTLRHDWDSQEEKSSATAALVKEALLELVKTDAQLSVAILELRATPLAQKEEIIGQGKRIEVLGNLVEKLAGAIAPLTELADKIKKGEMYAPVISTSRLQIVEQKTGRNLIVAAEGRDSKGFLSIDENENRLFATASFLAVNGKKSNTYVMDNLIGIRGSNDDKKLISLAINDDYSGELAFSDFDSSRISFTRTDSNGRSQVTSILMESWKKSGPEFFLQHQKPYMDKPSVYLYSDSEDKNSEGIQFINRKTGKFVNLKPPE